MACRSPASPACRCGHQRPLSRRQLRVLHNTDLDGYAGFNEVFPFLNWLVVETGHHALQVAGTHSSTMRGGPADASWRRCDGVTDAWRTASNRTLSPDRLGYRARATARTPSGPAGDSVVAPQASNGSCRSAPATPRKAGRGCSARTAHRVRDEALCRRRERRHQRHVI